MDEDLLKKLHHVLLEVRISVGAFTAALAERTLIGTPSRHA